MTGTPNCGGYKIFFQSWSVIRHSYPPTTRRTIPVLLLHRHYTLPAGTQAAQEQGVASFSRYGVD